MRFSALVAWTVLPAVDSFGTVDPPLSLSFHHGTSNSNSNSALRVSRFSTASPEEEDPSVFLDRRSLLVAGASSLTAGLFVANHQSSNKGPTTAILTTTEASSASTTTLPTTSTVSSVDEALTIIESMGDKRFLHAVVASDYQFLYEQTTPKQSQRQIISTSDDLDVEAIFSQKVPSNGNGSRSVVVAATGSQAPRRAPSLWPLEPARCSGAKSCSKDNGIHYAWPEQGGKLPTTNANAAATAVIVDGIDCGKMSLEDALEGDMQVLVQSPTYLSVPSGMEAELRRGLKEAFLI